MVLGWFLYRFDPIMNEMISSKMFFARISIFSLILPPKVSGVTRKISYWGALGWANSL